MVFPEYSTRVWDPEGRKLNLREHRVTLISGGEIWDDDNTTQILYGNSG